MLKYCMYVSFLQQCLPELGYLFLDFVGALIVALNDLVQAQLIRKLWINHHHHHALHTTTSIPVVRAASSSRAASLQYSSADRQVPCHHRRIRMSIIITLLWRMMT